MQTIPLYEKDDPSSLGDGIDEEETESMPLQPMSETTKTCTVPESTRIGSATFMWAKLNERYCFSSDQSILTIAETMFVTPEIVGEVFVRKIMNDVESFFETETGIGALIQYSFLWNYMVTQWNSIILAYSDSKSHDDDDDDDDDDYESRKLNESEIAIIEDVLRLVCIAVSTKRCVAKLSATSVDPPREIYLSSVGRDVNDVGEATFLCHIIKNLGYGFAFAYRRDQKKIVIPKYIQTKHVGGETGKSMKRLRRVQREKSFAEKQMDVYYSEYFSSIEDGAPATPTNGQIQIIFLDETPREEFDDEYKRRAMTILSSGLRPSTIGNYRLKRNVEEINAECNFPTCSIS